MWVYALPSRCVYGQMALCHCLLCIVYKARIHCCAWISNVCLLMCIVCMDLCKPMHFMCMSPYLHGFGNDQVTLAHPCILSLSIHTYMYTHMHTGVAATAVRRRARSAAKRSVLRTRDQMPQRARHLTRHNTQGLVPRTPTQSIHAAGARDPT